LQQKFKYVLYYIALGAYNPRKEITSPPVLAKKNNFEITHFLLTLRTLVY